MTTRAPQGSRGSRAARVIAATTLAIALVACSDDQQLADITTVATIAPPVTTEPAATTTDPASATTEQVLETSAAPTVPETTDVPTTTAADPGITGPMFSDALGVKVDTAPGVNTPGDTRQLLPEGLYVHIAWQADPNDPSVFTARDEDIEILEAYANAVMAYYQSATTDLRTDTDAMQRYLVDGEGMFGRAFSQAAEGDFVLDLGAGVVLRPYVTQRDSAYAVVYDCYLDDAQYKVRGSSRESGTPTATGQVATLILSDVTWKVDTASELSSACI